MYKKLLSIFLISISTNVYCGDAEQFCNYLAEVKQETRENNQNISSPFWSRLFNSSQTKPEYTEFRLETTDILHSTKKNEIKKLNNYIILFSPKNKTKEFISTELESLEIDKANFLTLDRNLDILLETDSTSDCMREYVEYPVTEKGYNTAHAKLISHQAANDTILVNKAKQQIVSAKKRGLYNKWIVIEQFDLDEVYRILNSSETGNIIIVAHSIGNTQSLVDSYGKIVPRNFFNQMSDTIQSINIFSCHSQNSVKHFDIKSLFNSTATIHKRRFFSNLRDNGGSNKAPVHEFRSYLKKIDQKIGRNKQKNIRSQRFSDKKKLRIYKRQCLLKVESNYPENELSITLNHRFLGTLRNGKIDIEFPCDFLDRDQFQIITFAKIMAKKIPTSGNFFFKIQLNGENSELVLRNETLRINKRTNHFNGGKFTFKRSQNVK